MVFGGERQERRDTCQVSLLMVSVNGCGCEVLRLDGMELELEKRVKARKEGGLCVMNHHQD